MTEHLAKRLVDHRGVGLASQAVSELALHHAEGGFDVRPFMVMRDKFIPTKHEVVKHLLPCPAYRTRSVGFESDKRSTSGFHNCLGILAAEISLVCRDLRDLEIPGSGLNHRREKGIVVGPSIANLNCGHDVGFDTAHQMTLDPFMLSPLLAVFHVKPANEAGRSEARGIYGEIGFYRFEGKAAPRNQFPQKRSHIGVLKVVENGIVVGGSRNKSACLRCSKIAHKAPPRHGGIDFERGAEYSVRQGQARTTRLSRLRVLEATAQVEKQSLESVLFVDLRGIVGWPVLWVSGTFGNRYGLGDRGTSVRVLFACHHENGCIDVLAFPAACFVIGTGARRRIVLHVNRVSSVPSLRGNHPQIALGLDFLSSRQFKSALLSRFHSHLVYLDNILLSRYIFVKGYLKKFLDNILLSSILFCSWAWSRLSKRGINVIVAATSGYPEKAPWANRRSVLVARIRTGTSRANTSAKRYNPDLSKGLAEGQGVEPTVLTHRSEFWRLLAASSDAPPLNGHGSRIRTGVSEEQARRPGPLDDTVIGGAGGEGALQTFIPHLHCKNLLFLLFSPFFPSRCQQTFQTFPRKVLLWNSESEHIFGCNPFNRKRPRLSPVVVDVGEKSNRRKSSTASSLRTVSLEVICSVIFLFHSLNTNPISCFVPKQNYKAIMVLGQPVRSAVVDGDTTVICNRHLRRGSPDKIASKDLKWHSSPLYAECCAPTLWPNSGESSMLRSTLSPLTALYTTMETLRQGAEMPPRTMAIVGQKCYLLGRSVVGVVI